MTAEADSKHIDKLSAHRRRQHPMVAAWVLALATALNPRAVALFADQGLASETGKPKPSLIDLLPPPPRPSRHSDTATTSHAIETSGQQRSSSSISGASNRISLPTLTLETAKEDRPTAKPRVVQQEELLIQVGEQYTNPKTIRVSQLPEGEKQSVGLDAIPLELLSPVGQAKETSGVEDLPAPPRKSRKDSAGQSEPVDALPLELLESREQSQLGSILEQQPSGRTSPSGLGSLNGLDSSQKQSVSRTKQADKKINTDIVLDISPPTAPHVDCGTFLVGSPSSDFAPSPVPACGHDPFQELSIYEGKFHVPTQRPILELGRPLYTGGMYPPAKQWFGPNNLVMPHLMVYGDFRTGVGFNRDLAGSNDNWASRLNLDIDLEITATERLHAFIGPIDRAGDFTRFDFRSNEFVNRTDLRLDTFFFEGDLGAIIGGMNDSPASFDLPFTAGFLPIIYQNGVWANDNIIGAAVALPARHSRLLKWSNFDATFFWASDQVTSDAFAGDNNAAEFFGTAWFIDAYEGYIEADYAFVHDDAGEHRSYHNLSFSFTRRYFDRISNAVRFIVNFGQALPDDQKTATGHLVLIENSLVSRYANTVVPYCNLFYGQGRPQSLARAGIVGGVLNNVGINFETDGLNGYPTLDPTGHNTFGGALGINLLGANYSHQLVLELAALSATGSANFRNVPGDQAAVGVRYQFPINNAMLIRTDHMYGWTDGGNDITGSRLEFRWKF